MNNETDKKEHAAGMLEYFNDAKTDKKKLGLFSAVYYDRTETALELIKTNPEQINVKDPYAGLTPIHIAIYRQNKKVVKALTEYPELDMQVKDVFDRLPVDMLDYTSNQEIFKMVMDAHSPESAAELRQIYEEFIEEFGQEAYDNMDEDAEIPVSDTDNVVPFKPDTP